MRVLLVLLCVRRCKGGRLGRPEKRRSTSVGYSGESSAQHLLNRAAEMLHLRTPQFVYHMDNSGARESLISDLWAGALSTLPCGRFTDSNIHFAHLLQSQTLDGAVPRLRELSTGPRFESVLSSIFRARSQKMVPLETAALSLQWLYYNVPAVVWDGVTHFSRAIMSRTWTETLCDEALAADPGPMYAVAEGISAAVFDNFRMTINYGSYATKEAAGYALDMTNWATVFLPANAMPTGFNIDSMLGNGGIFRTDRCLEDFLDLFSMGAQDIVENQRSRWLHYLEAAADGSIWHDDPYNSPYPPTHFHYHDPIWDRLQSSYEDVNYELKHMRSSRFHKFSDAIMLGGDGLSYMRLIHRLSQDPRQFLETKPLIIPRMGEAPHGKYHLMHGDWRLWSPLLMRFAVLLQNKQVRKDPGVEHFNTHEHFLRIVTRALAEYVLDISRSGTHYSATSHFLKDAEKNLSFAYIVFFLYLFAFKYLEFRRAVRRNDSVKLDLLWRENLASARTSTANKTNYRQMSVILIYWGWCLVEPLQTLYHNTRTLRWLHSHVGWDMPIEKLNMWIRASVLYRITITQIEQFIRRLNFLHIVIRAIKTVMYQNRIPATATDKEIDADVAEIKAFLCANIGKTYEQATTPSEENLLSIDLTDWGGNRDNRKGAPWNQMRRTADTYRVYVKEEVAKLCPWHHWQVGGNLRPHQE